MANEVYLSYARNNATLARAVYRFFRSSGLRVWFDEAASGEGSWLDRGQRAIRRARHHVILLTDSTPAAWQRAELDFAARGAALNPGLQTIPLIRDGYEAGELGEWLEDFDAQRLPSDKGLLDSHLKELVERLKDPDGIPKPPSPTAQGNPYPGLRPYGVNDARDFFGRDAELAEALGRLGTQPDGGHRRWLRIQGAGGVGKASFARAGMVPAVVRGGIAGAPTDWRVAAFRPAELAADSLTAAVSAAFAGLVSSSELRKALDADSGLTDLVHEHLPADQGLVLVIDHLDDVLTEGAHHPEQVARFDALLSEAVDDFDHRLFLFTTGRDDLAAEVLACMPKLAAIVDAHAAVYHLGGLTLAGIRDIMEGPARLAGRPWAEGLAAQITTDALRTPTLPGRLCWALEALWQGRRADTNRYADLGGLIGGPARAFEARYEGLGDDERNRTRSLMCGLVGGGRGHGDVSIALSMSDAAVAAGGGPRAPQLIDRLAANADDEGDPLTPLVTIARDGGVDYARLASATLPALWPRLAGWLREDRAVLERRHDIGLAAVAWSGDEADLPAGARLLYYAGGDLPDDQRLRLKAALRTPTRHFVEAAERREKELATKVEAATRAASDAKAKALAAERANTATQITRLRFVALLLLATAGAFGIFWLQATLTSGDLRTHVTSAQRKQAAAVEALRAVEQKHIAAEQHRKSAENERRTTERERRLADQEGAQAEDSADEMLGLVVAAVASADTYIGRIPHKDTDYSRRAALNSMLRDVGARLKTTPDNRRLRILLGRLYELSGDTAVAMGSIRGAQTEYEGSVKAFAALSEGDTADARDLQALATAYGKLGRYYADRRREESVARPKPALDALRSARDLWLRLAALQPGVPSHQEGAAAEHAMIGLVSHRAGRHAKALEALEAALKSTREMVQAQPADANARFALARRLGFAGDVVLDQGNAEDAAAHYAEALELVSKVPATDDTRRTRDRLNARLKRARAAN